MEYINSPVGAISRVGLGTWAMGGWGEVITSEADEMAVETIKKAVEMDVTDVDRYGSGVWRGTFREAGRACTEREWLS